MSANRSEDGEIRESERSLSPQLPVIKTTTSQRLKALTATRSDQNYQMPYDGEPQLPEEAPPEDDGWDFRQDPVHGHYIFFNKFTGAEQLENPRVPAATFPYGSYDRYVKSSAVVPTANQGAPGTSSPPKRLIAGGYNPAIHGNYDPNADYAQEAERQVEEAKAAAAATTNPFNVASAYGRPVGQEYSTTAHFNRFTGKFQHAGINPDYHNDENKSKRQMTAFFDVDAAANSHDGRSLKAERRNKPLSKKELKAYKERRREKQHEKKVNWLKKDN